MLVEKELLGKQMIPIILTYESSCGICVVAVTASKPVMCKVEFGSFLERGRNLMFILLLLRKKLRMKRRIS